MFENIVFGKMIRVNQSNFKGCLRGFRFGGISLRVSSLKLILRETRGVRTNLKVNWRNEYELLE